MRSGGALGRLIVVLIVAIGDHVVGTLGLRFQMVHQVVLQHLLRFLAAGVLGLGVRTGARLPLGRTLALSIQQKFRPGARGRDLRQGLVSLVTLRVVVIAAGVHDPLLRRIGGRVHIRFAVVQGELVHFLLRLWVHGHVRLGASRVQELPGSHLTARVCCARSTA